MHFGRHAFLGIQKSALAKILVHYLIFLTSAQKVAQSHEKAIQKASTRRPNAMRKQQSNQATKQRRNEATKQQSNKATKQPSNQATKQQSNKATKAPRHPGTQAPRAILAFQWGMGCDDQAPTRKA